MKDLLKYLGVIFILIGVVILSIYAYQSMISNTRLVSAGLFLIGGLALHIGFNKIFN